MYGVTLSERAFDDLERVLDFLDDGKGPATMIRRGVGLDNCAARLKAGS